MDNLYEMLSSEVTGPYSKGVACPVTFPLTCWYSPVP